MSLKPVFALLLLAWSASAPADTQMKMGDGLIDGAKLEPYRLDWRQCVLRDGEWHSQPPLTEELVVIGNSVVRLRQTGAQPDGTATRSDTYFDRSSLAPLRMETSASKNGEVLGSSVRNLGKDGYTGIATRGDTSKRLQGAISSLMLHGGAMGLPLATMEYQSEPVEFLASMIGFDATYTVVAEWVGEESLDFGDQVIDAWLIDVEWHHRESGDVYPRGPDASGGRYWVVANPPDGYPYVPRYQTDKYVVEFGPGVCPPAPN